MRRRIFDRLTVDPTRFTVGQHCGGCAVKTACKAFSVAVKKYLAPEYKDATADRLKVWPALLEIAKPAEKFFAEIQSQAFAYLSAGGTIPGWGLKAVAGRRTWSKEATADALAKAFRVKADVFEKRSLESVAAVEKVLKTAGVDSQKLASFYYQPATPRLTKTEHEEKFLTAKQSKAKPVKGKKKIEKVQKVKRKK
ncbi:MAG: DUF2800 domain-containing protein [Micavibrio sp.]|nr:DUF2800 domain-containing protein [Micavibrio sp.]